MYGGSVMVSCEDQHGSYVGNLTKGERLIPLVAIGFC